MKNYPKRHLIRLYQAETRKVEVNGEKEQLTVKVYFKFSKTAEVFADGGYDPQNEGIDIKAYARQLSAEERNASMALQDDSSIEVAINKRQVTQDMYMEFKGNTYQIGAPDNFQFEGTEVKFRAKEVVPVEFDIVEYRGYAK